jgi:hypothetical protein
MHAVEGRLLGGRCRGVELDLGAADRHFDRSGLGDRPLQRDPPQPSGAFGEIARHIDGERRAKFAHHRQGVIAVVAIAVIEGEAGEAPREIARLEPLMHLVHGDDVDVERAKVCQHRPQEFRLDLEVMVGLKLAVATGADVMQHENDANTCEDWSQQKVRAGEVQRFQSGANDGVAKQFHRDVRAARLFTGRN